MRTVVAVCALLALSAPVASAQAQTFAHGADGHTDFQGVWESRWVTPLERMPGAEAVSVDGAIAKLLVAKYFEGMAMRPGNANPDSDMDLTGLAPADGKYRTSLVVDPDNGRIPFAAHSEKAIQEFFEADALNNPEERDPAERCIAGGGRAPMLVPPSNGYMQIVQTPDSFVILSEGLGDLRILPFNGLRPDARLTSPHGLSAAHWEGDVFVVETTDFRSDDVFRIAPPQGILMLSPRSVVTERFTPISANEFRYRFTIVDADLYTKPWSAETTWVRTDARLYEYACHEANYSLTNMLKGGRRLDRPELSR